MANASEIVLLQARLADLEAVLEQARLDIASSENSNNTAWFFSCAFLLFTMQGGFALLESGMIASRFSINVLMKVTLNLATAAIAFFATGWAFFASTCETSPGLERFLGCTGFFLRDTNNPLTFTYELSVAVIASTLISGAVAGRMRFGIYIVVSFIVVAFVFPISLHWSKSNSGFLAHAGYHDFAGAGPLHVVAGTMGVVCSWVLGPRRGVFTKNGAYIPVRSNPTSAVFGSLVLFVGWLTLHASSGPGISGKFADQVATAATNSAIAAGGGIIAVVVTLYMLTGWSHVNPFDLIIATQASVVSISACCPVVDSKAAIVIGAVGTVLCVYAGRLLVALRIDDPVGIFGSHVVAGAWSVLATGLFSRNHAHSSTDVYISSESSINLDAHNGLFYGGGLTLLGWQIVGLITFLAWGAFWGGPFIYLFQRYLGSARFNSESEMIGADTIEHDTIVLQRNFLADVEDAIEQGAALGKRFKFFDDDTRLAVSTTLNSTLNSTLAAAPPAPSTGTAASPHGSLRKLKAGDAISAAPSCTSPSAEPDQSFSTSTSTATRDRRSHSPNRVSFPSRCSVTNLTSIPEDAAFASTQPANSSTTPVSSSKGQGSSRSSRTSLAALSRCSAFLDLPRFSRLASMDSRAGSMMGGSGSAGEGNGSKGSASGPPSIMLKADDMYITASTLETLYNLEERSQLEFLRPDQRRLLHSRHPSALARMTNDLGIHFERQFVIDTARAVVGEEPFIVRIMNHVTQWLADRRESKAYRPLAELAERVFEMQCFGRNGSELTDAVARSNSIVARMSFVVTGRPSTWSVPENAQAMLASMRPAAFSAKPVVIPADSPARIEGTANIVNCRSFEAFQARDNDELTCSAMTNDRELYIESFAPRMTMFNKLGVEVPIDPVEMGLTVGSTASISEAELCPERNKGELDAWMMTRIEKRNEQRRVWMEERAQKRLEERKAKKAQHRTDTADANPAPSSLPHIPGSPLLSIDAGTATTSTVVDADDEITPVGARSNPRRVQSPAANADTMAYTPTTTILVSPAAAEADHVEITVDMAPEPIAGNELETEACTAASRVLVELLSKDSSAAEMLATVLADKHKSLTTGLVDALSAPGSPAAAALKMVLAGPDDATAAVAAKALGELIKGVDAKTADVLCGLMQQCRRATNAASLDPEQPLQGRHEVPLFEAAAAAETVMEILTEVFSQRRKSGPSAADAAAEATAAAEALVEILAEASGIKMASAASKFAAETLINPGGDGHQSLQAKLREKEESEMAKLASTTTWTIDKRFQFFSKAAEIDEMLSRFQSLLELAGVSKDLAGLARYDALRSACQHQLDPSQWFYFRLISNRVETLLLESKHQYKSCAGLKVVVCGAGPIGLRTALELAFLGADVTVVERHFTRHRKHVTQLWRYVCADLLALGASETDCKGLATLHVPIKFLTRHLMRLALILGVKIVSGTRVDGIVQPEHPSNTTDSWAVKATNVDTEEQVLFPASALVVASGAASGLPRKLGFRHTVNTCGEAYLISGYFNNEGTEAEVSMKDCNLSGRDLNMATKQFFEELKKSGIEISTINYTQGIETHFFMMSVSRATLVNTGVMIKDLPGPRAASRANINKENLFAFTREMATRLGLPPICAFSDSDKGARIFDTTYRAVAQQSCKVLQSSGGEQLAVMLAGDALQESFFFEALGINRGLRHALDSAWCIQKFFNTGRTENPKTMERTHNAMFHYLHDLDLNTYPDILKDHYRQYEMDPQTRYKNFHQA